MVWSFWNCGSREGAGINQGIGVLGGLGIVRSVRVTPGENRRNLGTQRSEWGISRSLRGDVASPLPVQSSVSLTSPSINLSHRACRSAEPVPWNNTQMVRELWLALQGGGDICGGPALGKVSYSRPGHPAALSLGSQASIYCILVF